QARLEGVEDTVDHRGLQVADLQVELGATGYHVDPARIESDDADVGHGVPIDALNQLAQAGDGARGRPAGVAAQAKGGGPGMVLLALDNHVPACHPHDPGHHRQVLARLLQTRALLDVKLEVGGDLGHVPPRVGD